VRILIWWVADMGNLSTQDKASWPDLIHDAQVETAEAFRAWHAARDAGAPASDRIRLRKRADDAVARSNELQRACRQAFAESRGWRWNRKAWTADLANDARGSNGARFIDHVEFFDSPDERKVAMVTHSYAPAQELADYAARRGYIAEKLPFSWWNPRFNGGCRCVVFTRKAGVKWR
jgi:hypothetical protein